jgi:peroxiredoxin Q/BCP
MRSLIPTLLVLSALSLAGGARGEDLGAGDRAPGFTLQGSDGAAHELGRLLDARGLVLAFFPKAFTPG